MEEPDKAVKIEKNDMQAASAGYEYETLMRLMGVSVSKHLLDRSADFCRIRVIIFFEE